MKIILLRHGKPDIETDHKYTADKMAQWIAAYDHSEVSEDPPAELISWLSTHHYPAVASPLPRAITSLNKLGIEPTVVDPDFREAQLPLINLLGLTLSPLTYAFWLRILWLAGFSAKVESRALAQKRAVQAADKLIKLAENNQSVLLMGHGIFNRMLGAELKKEGFSVSGKTGKGYWHAVTYEKSH
ncbi:phosphoglycerate mutase family protein [Yokenella regensburgei]|uniref:histidine phosphatase family protein n=1 Tax=Yokenella regensburgei TaxID=158877 RepID=UPI003F1908C0